MAKVPNIIPVTDLRQDAAAALKRLKSSKEPVVITQRGRAAAVLLSLEEYERGESERHLLRRIASGEKEVAAGKGFDLAVALKEPEAVYRAERTIPGDRELPRTPVIEAYKKDVDRTLLVENLRRTVPQRMASLVSMNRFVEEAREAMKKAIKKRKRSR